MRPASKKLKMSSPDHQAVDLTTALDGFYLVNCTNFITPNAEFVAVVNVLDTKVTCTMTLALEGPQLNVPAQTIQVEPMSSQRVTFQVPFINDGNGYKLVVTGTEGLVFSDSVALFYRATTLSVFVQTDRATYKPGDLVQFRVLLLDEYLRPAHTAEKPIAVHIADSEKNRIKQFALEALTNGVYSASLQLSEYTVLGNWSIVVAVDGKELCTKTFAVDKYILPTFDVVLEAPKKVCASQETFPVAVLAKYAYGQFLEGQAVITVKPIKAFYGRGGLVCRHLVATDAEKEQGFQKTVPIKGKTVVELELAHVLKDEVPMHGMYIEVSVAVTDELTGKEEKGSATVPLVHRRFNIKCPHVSERLPESYDRNMKIPYTINVTDLNDEPVLDTVNPLRVTLETNNVICWGPVEVHLDEKGEAKVEIPVGKPDRYCNVRVEYRQIIEIGSFHAHVYQKEHHFGLQVKTETPLLGKAIDLALNWSDSIGYFVYTVVAHGRILKSEILNVADVNEKTLKLSLESTFDMMPHAKVYAQYICGKELRSYDATFTIEREFLNRVAITGPAEAQPGDEVALNIETDKDSFVGLLAVDQSVLLLKSGNDFDKDDIWNRIENKGRQGRCYYIGYQGDNKLVTLSNAKVQQRHDFPMYRMARGPANILAQQAQQAQQFQLQQAQLAQQAQLSQQVQQVQQAQNQRMSNQMAVPESAPEPPRVRKDFLETWFFDDLHMESASMELRKVIPDSITSWVVTGFAVHPSTGFALTKEPTKIKTFRPFFMVTNLPYSIKRGEVVTIPIIVFNYSEEPVTAEVVLAANDEDFDGKSDLTLTVEIPAGGGETVNFVIQPKKVGHVTLKVTACSQRYSDAVEKELKVEPEGLVVHHNHDLFFDTKSDQSALQKSLKLEIPDTIVPDSEHIEVSVMGDILGSTIPNLHKLVRMPCGCGEQNMVNFVPNILVLDYLVSTHHLTKTIEETAKRHLNIGYQRELTYKHDDGSYSAFGKSDKSGSTWLTAYVVRSFVQAAKYVEIDPKIVAEGVKFLHGQQEADGSFKELGQLFDFTHLDAFGLTAFVLIALIDHLNSAEGDKDWSFVNKGINYLKQNVGKSESSHAVAMAVYALNLRHSCYSVHLKLLESCLKSEDGYKWWTSFPKNKTKSGRPWICMSAKNYDIEITSYVLMAMMAAPSDTEQSLPIIKWLISKRNSNGGFSTTQDTVVALQALIQFAKKINSSIGEFEVAVSDAASGVACGKLHINRNNSLVVQSLELPKNVRDVKYDIRGDGSGLLQIAYRYNIAAKAEGPAFAVSLKAKRESAGLLKLTALVKYLLSSPSNMVVMEISLPSGYKAVAEQFADIEGSAVKRVETQNEDTKVIVYFESFSEGFNHSLELTAARSHVVSAHKPSVVKLYDYYDNAKETTSFYDIAA